MTDPISHVNVWSDDDELVVSWRGGSADLSVFVSDDADDAGVDVRAPDAPGRTVIPRTSGRVYVHLFEPSQGFVVAAERRVPMEGPTNFRDLGGYPTDDGATTRWGRVYRSDGLHAMSELDRASLLDLGVTTVFDLRSDAEVESAPDRLPDGIAHVHIPMSSDVAQQRSMLQRIIDGELSKFDEDDMSAGYLRMLEGFPDHLARVIGAVADGERVLFHCTAGKDRTGITAMTMLGLAGVGDSHILDDYEITERYWAGAGTGSGSFAAQIRSAGHDPDDFRTLGGSPRAVMRKTLAGLRERWGDHNGFIRNIGVPDAVAERARKALRAAS